MWKLPWKYAPQYKRKWTPGSSQLGKYGLQCTMGLFEYRQTAPLYQKVLYTHKAEVDAIAQILFKIESFRIGWYPVGWVLRWAEMGWVSTSTPRQCSQWWWWRWPRNMKAAIAAQFQKSPDCFWFPQLHNLTLFDERQNACRRLRQIAGAPINEQKVWPWLGPRICNGFLSGQLFNAVLCEILGTS